MPSGTVSWVPGELRGWGLPGWGGLVPAPHPQQARSPSPTVKGFVCINSQLPHSTGRDTEAQRRTEGSGRHTASKWRHHVGPRRSSSGQSSACPGSAARPQASPPTPSRAQPPTFQPEPFWPPAPRGQTELLAPGSKDPRTRTRSGLRMLRSSSEGGESGGGREARRAVPPGLWSPGNV